MVISRLRARRVVVQTQPNQLEQNLRKLTELLKFVIATLTIATFGTDGDELIATTSAMMR